MREHGHFYNGLRAGFWRWEVVKRMDVLCDYLETYVPVFAGALSELALFTAICAFFWAVHGGYMTHLKAAPRKEVQMPFGRLLKTAGKRGSRAR